MKSKTIVQPKQSTEKVKGHNSYEFVNFYKPASESSVKLIEKQISEESSNREKENSLKTKGVVTKEHSPSKKKKKIKNDGSFNLSNSQMNVDDQVISHGLKSSSDIKLTSTPNSKGTKDFNANVKSIMKNSEADNSVQISTIMTPNNKSKKRNKSVSFMLEESEDILVKKAKSEQSLLDNKKSDSKFKKQKKKAFHKSENQNANISTTDIGKSDVSVKKSKKIKSKEVSQVMEQVVDISPLEQESKTERKKNKKQNKTLTAEGVLETGNDNNSNVENVKKIKKIKKNHQSKPSESEETDDKSSKLSMKELKPEVIAEGLESLNIGDNPHTLTNLLDEMAVVDKNKKKKDRKNLKKNNPKHDSKLQASKQTVSTSNEEKEANEEKEKIKWMKRKWNKDKKGAVNDDKLSTSIIIENLPLKIMCNYKKLLMDYFSKFGIIKQVGVAELYSIEDPEVFTTTIWYNSEDAAEKSLEEDNTLFEGNHIRIKRPMPPSQTTVVVRSYADLSEPALSSVFTSAGKIRNVRRLVKGKKSMSTAFIEFDGPEAVTKAIKMAEDVKIGGKKIFASKYEPRNKNKKQKKDNQNEEDSEDSD